MGHNNIRNWARTVSACLVSLFPLHDLRLLFKLVSNLPHILSEPFHGRGKKSYMLTKIRSTEGLRQPLAFRRLKNG